MLRSDMRTFSIKTLELVGLFCWQPVYMCVECECVSVSVSVCVCMCVWLSLFVLFPWHPLPPRCFLSVSMSNSVRSNLSWEFKHCRCMHTHCQRPTGACYTVSYCENSVCVCVCVCVCVYECMYDWMQCIEVDSCYGWWGLSPASARFELSALI